MDTASTHECHARYECMVEQERRASAIFVEMLDNLEKPIAEEYLAAMRQAAREGSNLSAVIRRLLVARAEGTAALERIRKRLAKLQFSGADNNG